MAVENIALIAHVRAHLQDDKRLAGMPVDILCNGGYVELVGWVETVEQKKLAVMLARGIPGVRSVEDRIRIRRSVTVQVA